MTGVCPTCGGPTPLGKSGKPRKWCSDECRRSFYSQPCPGCGRPMSGSDGNGPNAPKLCLTCNGERSGDMEKQRWATYSATRDRRIIELMTENATNSEIGLALGYTAGSVGQFIVRLRRKGVELPERSRTKPAQNGNISNFG